MEHNKENKKVTKVVKPKGPIRIEAIVPTAIIVALLWAYMHFFFDGHLRKGAEFTGGLVHGAEVNIESINSSFWGGSFELKGLQVTDKELPTRNLVGINSIRFGMLWDALLRMKFVVSEAAIEGIKIYAPREKAGWVAPPPKPDDKPSALAEIQGNALKQAQEDNKENIVGDAAKMLDGVKGDEVLGQIKGELQSEKRIGELEKELKTKEVEWKKRLESLPKSAELEALNDKIKGLKFDNPKDFKTLKTVLEEADDKIKNYKETGSVLSGDLKKYSAEIKQIDDWIKKDIADIESRLNIPKMSGADFAKSIFMKSFGQKLASVQKYWTVAEQYMPPPKTAEQKAAAEARKIVPRKRLDGQNIRFPVKTGYPLFWLQKAKISSVASTNGFTGNINGVLTDLSTDPHIVKNPTLLKMNGDFPNQGVYGIDALLTLDHRTKDSKDSIVANVAGFPAPSFEIAKGSVDIQLAEAKGSSQLSALYQGGSLDMVVKNQFMQPRFEIDAKSKSTKEAFESILNDMKMVDMNASAKGPWNKLKIDIDSNLGKALSEGMKNFVKAKVDALKAKVRAQVEGQVKEQREKLEQQYAKAKGSVDKVLDSKKKEFDEANEKLKSSGKSTQKEKAREKGKDLLKKLKFK